MKTHLAGWSREVGSLGGLASADAECTAGAALANLPGENWIAWMSDASRAALVAGQLLYPATLNAEGSVVPVPNSTYSWGATPTLSCCAWESTMGE